MLLLYAYDTNAILVKPIKTRNDVDMLRAYVVLYDILEYSGKTTKWKIMDNEASTALGDCYKKEEQ